MNEKEYLNVRWLQRQPVQKPNAHRISAERLMARVQDDMRSEAPVKPTVLPTHASRKTDPIPG